jgi:hypothetical protein
MKTMSCSPSIENKGDRIRRQCSFWKNYVSLAFTAINARAEEAVAGVPFGLHRGVACYGLALSCIDRNSEFSAY